MKMLSYFYKNDEEKNEKNISDKAEDLQIIYEEKSTSTDDLNSIDFKDPRFSYLKTQYFLYGMSFSAIFFGMYAYIIRKK